MIGFGQVAALTVRSVVSVDFELTALHVTERLIEPVAFVLRVLHSVGAAVDDLIVPGVLERAVLGVRGLDDRNYWTCHWFLDEEF